MRKYEGVFIFKPNLEDDVRNQAFDGEIENLLMKLTTLKRDIIL